MTNNQLKAAIVARHGKQWVFARIIGVDESFVSKIVTGARQLRPEDKAVWAKELGRDVREIFPEAKP